MPATRTHACMYVCHVLTTTPRQHRQKQCKPIYPGPVLNTACELLVAVYGISHHTISYITSHHIMRRDEMEGERLLPNLPRSPPYYCTRNMVMTKEG